MLKMVVKYLWDKQCLDVQLFVKFYKVIIEDNKYYLQRCIFSFILVSEFCSVVRIYSSVLFGILLGKILDFEIEGSF